MVLYWHRNYLVRLATSVYGFFYLTKFCFAYHVAVWHHFRLKPWTLFSFSLKFFSLPRYFHLVSSLSSAMGGQSLGASNFSGVHLWTQDIRFGWCQLLPVSHRRDAAGKPFPPRFQLNLFLPRERNFAFLIRIWTSFFRCQIDSNIWQYLCRCDEEDCVPARFSASKLHQYRSIEKEILGEPSWPPVSR